MEPLRDPKEVRTSADHDPPAVDPETADVRQDRAQHFSHSAAGRRRIHAPHGSSLKPGANLLAQPLGPRYRFGAADRKEAIDRLGAELYFLDAYYVVQRLSLPLPQLPPPPAENQYVRRGRQRGCDRRP